VWFLCHTTQLEHHTPKSENTNKYLKTDLKKPEKTAEAAPRQNCPDKHQQHQKQHNKPTATLT